MKKRFCHECGAPAELEATFCEECGAELRPFPATVQAAAAPTPAPVLTPGPKISRKALMIAGGGLGGLILLGGVAWFVLADKPATEAELRSALELRLKDSDETRSRRPCIQNFDYRANPALVSPNDMATQNWLGVLVKAGIYNAPTQVATGNPWEPMQLRYEKGTEANKYLTNNQLCAASQLKLARIDVDPKKEFMLGGLRALRGSATLSWQDRASWSMEEPVKAAFDGRFGDLNEGSVWVRDKDTWRIATQADHQRERAEKSRPGAKLGQEEMARPASSGFNPMKLFSGLFGGPTPAQVTEKFVQALGKGNTQDALEYLPPAQRSPMGAAGIVVAMSAGMAMHGGLKSVETRELDGPETRREVRVKMIFNDGFEEQANIQLRKIDDRWMVTL